jgi:hypothetical protein
MNKRLRTVKKGLTSDSQDVTCRLISIFGACDRRGTLLVLTVVLFLSATTTSRAGTTTSLGLSEVPLEQLLNMDVTILREHDTPSKISAAIFVVTSDDIRRSGFNDVFANKLLVLQDGRTAA